MDDLLTKYNTLVTRYSSLYAEALFICFALFVVLLVSNLAHHKRGFNRNLLFLYIIMMACCFTDLMWHFVDEKEKFALFNNILNGFYMLVSCFMGYFWLAFVCDQVKIGFLKQRWVKIVILALPCAIGIFSFTSIWNGLIYYIDPVTFKYNRGPLYPIQASVSYVYCAIASIISIIAAIKAELKVQKKRYVVYALFVVPSVVFGGIQAMLPPGLPMTYFGSLLSLFFVYSSSITEQITKEPLTELPNRITIEAIFHNLINKHKSVEDGLWVVMSDIDEFKKINDTYGHLAGDRALKQTANALKNTPIQAGKVSLARLGGDEFQIVIEGINNEGIVQDYLMALTNAAFDASKGEKYKIRISFGYCHVKEGMSAKQAIDIADKDLYKNKRANKARRAKKVEK